MTLNAFLALPVVGFIRKNLLAAVLLALFLALALNDAAFGLVGTLSYLPVMVVAALIGVRLLRHLSGFKTTNAYTDQLVTKVRAWDSKANAWIDTEVGNFTADFHALPPATKCWIVTVERGFALLFIALIIMHLWK